MSGRFGRMPSLGTKSLKDNERIHLLETGPFDGSPLPPKLRSLKSYVVAATITVILIGGLLLIFGHRANGQSAQPKPVTESLECTQNNSTPYATHSQRGPLNLKDAIAKGDTYVKAMEAPIAEVTQSTFTSRDQLFKWGWKPQSRDPAENVYIDNTLKQAIWWLRDELNKHKVTATLDVEVSAMRHKYSTITKGQSGQPAYAPYTDSLMVLALDPKFIGAMWAESPQQRAGSSGLVPELQYWSDVAFLEYQHRYPNQLKQLEAVTQTHIYNKPSADIIKEIFAQRQKPDQLPGATFDYEDGFDEFKALLAIPNGLGTANLLSQHKAQLGQKCVWMIHVWFPKNDRGAPSVIYRVRDFPCGPSKKKRAPSTLKDAVAHGEAYIRAMDAPISAVPQSKLLKQELLGQWGWVKDTDRVAGHNRAPLERNFQDAMEYLRKQKDPKYKYEHASVHNMVLRHYEDVTKTDSTGKSVSYPATMGQLDVAIDRQFIGVRYAESPSMAFGAGRSQNVPALPDLQHFSDLAFLLYQANTPANQIKELSGVVRDCITEPRSMAIISELFKKIPKVQDFPGTAFDYEKNTEGFKALLAIPNGSGVVNLLAQHKTQLGNKCIGRVLVWWPSDNSGQPSLLYLFKDGPCGTKTSKRADNPIAKGAALYQKMHGPFDLGAQSLYLDSGLLDRSGWVADPTVAAHHTAVKVVRYLNEAFDSAQLNMANANVDPKRALLKWFKQDRSLDGALDAAYSPQFIAVTEWLSPARDYYEGPRPEIGDLSDILFLQYQRMFPHGVAGLRGISFYWQRDETLRAIAAARGRVGIVVSRGHRISESDPNELQAVLATQSGEVVVRLLTEHREQLGHQCVTDVYMWRPSRATPAFHLLYKIGDCNPYRAHAQVRRHAVLKRLPSQELVAHGTTSIQLMNAAPKDVRQSHLTRSSLLAEWGWTNDAEASNDQQPQGQLTPNFQKIFLHLSNQATQPVNRIQAKDVQYVVLEHSRAVSRGGQGGKEVTFPASSAKLEAVYHPLIIGVNTWIDPSASGMTPSPAVRDWSDVAFLKYQELFPSDMSKLAGVAFLHVSDAITTTVVKDLLNTLSSQAKFPGVVLSGSDSDKEQYFKALLGVPSGAGVTELLTSHKKQLGNKCVSKVYVWAPPDVEGKANLFYELKDSPC